MSFFKMKEYDDLGEDNILARAGTINAFGHDIDTPSPIPTNFDHEKLVDLKKSTEHLKNLDFTQPITEIDKFYSPKMLNNLKHKDSPASIKLKNQIEDICSQVKLSMFRLITKRDVEFTDKLNDIYTEIQIQAKTSIILINDIKFNSSADAFEKRIIETRDYVENHHNKAEYCSICPVIRMDMPLDLFEQKIDVIKNNGFDGIVLIHAPYYTTLKKYLYIQKIAKDMENLWLHLAGCTPIWYVNKKTSLPHFYSLFGFDTSSVLQPRKFGKKQDRKKPIKKEKQKPRFKKFNNANWGLVEPSEWDTCDCPVDKGHKDSSSFINAWNGSDLIFQALNYHNFVHGHRGMIIERDAIMHKELYDCLKSRRYITEVVRVVLGKDLNQGSLKNWL